MLEGFPGFGAYSNEQLFPEDREGIAGVTPEQRRIATAKEAGAIVVSTKALDILHGIGLGHNFDGPIDGGFIGVPGPIDPKHPDADSIIDRKSD